MFCKFSLTDRRPLIEVNDLLLILLKRDRVQANLQYFYYEIKINIIYNNSYNNIN